jgi:hypothetical protein
VSASPREPRWHERPHTAPREDRGGVRTFFGALGDLARGLWGLARALGDLAFDLTIGRLVH